METAIQVFMEPPNHWINQSGMQEINVWSYKIKYLNRIESSTQCSTLRSYRMGKTSGIRDNLTIRASVYHAQLVSSFRNSLSQVEIKN